MAEDFDAYEVHHKYQRVNIRNQSALQFTCQLSDWSEWRVFLEHNPNTKGS